MLYDGVFMEVVKCDVYCFVMVCYKILFGNMFFVEIISFGVIKRSY